MKRLFFDFGGLQTQNLTRPPYKIRILSTPAGIQSLESHSAALLYTAGSEKADDFGGLQPQILSFNDSTTTEIYTLALNDALPIHPAALLYTAGSEKADDFP